MLHDRLALEFVKVFANFALAAESACAAKLAGKIVLCFPWLLWKFERGLERARLLHVSESGHELGRHAGEHRDLARATGEPVWLI